LASAREIVCERARRQSIGVCLLFLFGAWQMLSWVEVLVTHIRRSVRQEHNVA
jgi:hypothetical protein